MGKAAAARVEVTAVVVVREAMREVEAAARAARRETSPWSCRAPRLCVYEVIASYPCQEEPIRE